MVQMRAYSISVVGYEGGMKIVLPKKTKWRLVLSNLGIKASNVNLLKCFDCNVALFPNMDSFSIIVYIFRNMLLLKQHFVEITTSCYLYIYSQ